MAGKRIRGLTVEIGGDSTDLQKALRAPEREISSLKSELKEINTALKFDPSNVELLGQKSAVLGNEIAATSEKLKTLKDVQEQVSQQAERGDIGEEQYRAFQRELEKTESQLNSLKNQLKDNGDQIKQVGESTDEASKSSEKFQRAVEAQRKATDQAKESSAEHGNSVRNLKDDYAQAEQGALSFADVVKASAIGSVIASGLKQAASALWDFAMEGAEAAKVFETNYAKLSQVMQNTMRLGPEAADAVVRFIEAQERLGVVTKETQTAGAQELATYLSYGETLTFLIPVMNDMVAQQYGVNASQESAVNIGTMLGKVMNGQVSALSRLGYSFTEAQEKTLKYGNELARASTLSKVVQESVGGMNYELRKTTQEGALFGQALDIGDIQEKFGKNAESIKNSLLITILPSLTEGLQIINDYVVENGEVLTNLGTIFATIINVLTNLLKVVGAVPPELLMMIGVIILAVKAYTEMKKALTPTTEALAGMGKSLGQWNNSADGFIVKILAVVAALSVLLFLVLSLKEGTDKATTSMNGLSNAAGNMANTNVNTAQRGYASGTPNARRGSALVGEEGPELVLFRGGERVFPAGRTAAILSGGVSSGASGGSQTVNHYNITVANVDRINDVIDWYETRRRFSNM